MLEKRKKIDKRLVSLLVLMVMVMCSSIVVFAKTNSGTFGGGFTYTWTGTYTDGVLTGTTSTNANMSNGYTNYVEVKLQYVENNEVKDFVNGANKAYGKSCTKRLTVGTGKEVRVWHHVYYRTSSASWSPAGYSIY